MRFQNEHFGVQEWLLLRDAAFHTLSRRLAVFIFFRRLGIAFLSRFREQVGPLSGVRVIFFDKE